MLKQTEEYRRKEPLISKEEALIVQQEPLISDQRVVFPENSFLSRANVYCFISFLYDPFAPSDP